MRCYLYYARSAAHVAPRGSALMMLRMLFLRHFITRHTLPAYFTRPLLICLAMPLSRQY